MANSARAEEEMRGAAAAAQRFSQQNSPSAPRMPAVVPEQITYQGAADREVLENWIFAADKMLQQQKLAYAPFALQERALKLYWDRELTRWWHDTAEVKKKQGSEVASWEQLQQLLRSTFLSTVDEDTAVAELRRAEMKGSEDMLAYTQRIAALCGRVSVKRVPRQMAAEFLAEGVPVLRFPALAAAYKREQAEFRRLHGGEGMELDAVRDRLVELAKSEPAEVAAAARREAAAAAARSSGSSSVSGSSSGSRSNWQQKPQAAVAQSLAKKLSAIATSMEQQAEEEGGTEGFTDEQRTFLQSILGSSKPAPQQLRCFRCKQAGHAANDCKKPDTRSCYGCGQAGHLRRDCPKQAQQGGDGGQQPSSKPKNM
jgi:hypothetical protein